MEFKKLRRLFSSSKKVDSANNSPSESDNRKRRSIRILGFAAVLIEFAKKHCKRASSPNQVHSSVPSRSYLSFSCFNGKKLRAETSTLVASSLGLNRIKTRSLRATLEACFSFRNDEATPVVVRSDDLPELNTHQDSGTSSDDHICSRLSCSCCCYIDISIIVFSRFDFDVAKQIHPTYHLPTRAHLRYVIVSP